MVSALSPVFGFASAVSAFVAAFFWFRASAVPVSPSWAIGDLPSSLSEPVDQNQASNGWIVGVVSALQDSGKLNRRGALWSGIAALTAGLSILASSLA
ncbi:hypothetical protein [Xanthobacter flavus]|uniref:hypothetical protein n=1 Tax=Xanthobacter flavus TaxID=281 RepID=UPI00372C3300